MKFGPRTSKNKVNHRDWQEQTWHFDESYTHIGSKWCYLWRAIDQYGRLIDFRLTTRRDAKATLQVIETIRTIKNNHIHQHKSGTLSEIEHLHKLFGLAA